MALRINFYGGPGVGKSTLAARVYAELSRAGVMSVELVQEFVKPWAYEGRKLDGFDQIYTFSQQLWAEHRLFRAGVEIIVTDSPVLLQCVYTHLADPALAKHLQEVGLLYEATYPSLNFLVLRTVPYRHIGRYQDEPDLQKLDDQIETSMGVWKLPYNIVNVDNWETVIQIAKDAAYNGA